MTHVYEMSPTDQVRHWEQVCSHLAAAMADYPGNETVRRDRVKAEAELLRAERLVREASKPLEVSATWQTRARGTNDNEYQIYLACADDGKGGDVTRGGEPLKTYDEWINS